MNVGLLPVYLISMLFLRKTCGDGKPLFLKYEKIILAILLLVALAAVYLFARGIVKF